MRNEVIEQGDGPLTVGKLREALADCDDSAAVWAYEGEITAIVVSPGPTIEARFVTFGNEQ